MPGEEPARPLRHAPRRWPTTCERYLDGESIQARSLNVLDYLGRTLERSQFDIEFRTYGNILLVFAAIVGVTARGEALPDRDAPAGVDHRRPRTSVQFVLMVAGAVAAAARKGLLPTTTAERLLWSVWMGYIVLRAWSLSELTRRCSGEESLYQGVLYPYYAVLTGMAFFVLGASYWGKCYAVAVAFFALSRAAAARSALGDAGVRRAVGGGA